MRENVFDQVRIFPRERVILGEVGEPEIERETGLQVRSRQAGGLVAEHQRAGTRIGVVVRLGDGEDDTCPRRCGGDVAGGYNSGFAPGGVPGVALKIALGMGSSA